MPGAKPSSALGGSLAGLLGGAVFLLLWLAFSFPFLLALLAGAAGFGAGLLLFVRRSRGIVVGLDPAMAALREQTLREAREKLAEIRSFAARITAQRPRETARDVVAAIEQLLTDLEGDVRDVAAARRVFTYYLDAAVRIMGSYVELAGKNLGSPGIDASLARAESALDTLRAAFRAQHGRVLENDVMDLDTEIALLKKTVDMDGLGERTQ